MDHRERYEYDWIKHQSRSNAWVIALSVFLALVLGASMAIAGIGVFLASNQVDVRSLLAGTYTERQDSDFNDELSQTPNPEIIIQNGVGPVAAIAQKAIPSIVGIEIIYPVMGFMRTIQLAKGEGSGIILTEDGYIVTNNHVVENALEANQNTLLDRASIKVYIYGKLDQPYDAIVVGRDAESDIALLKIEPTVNLVVAEIGDSDALQVGELAVAVGNPGGMTFMGSVTSGVISGLNRVMNDSSTQDPVFGNREILRLIQTDAAINPGNSGGALLNSQGKVVGINTLKIFGIQYEGLGFAIPINRAMEIVEKLRTTGRVTRGNPMIGILINGEFTPAVAQANGLPTGLMISQIVNLSPAYAAGLQEYDIITAMNEVPVVTFNDLRRELFRYRPGDTIIIRVFRPDRSFQSGEYLNIELVLGES